MSQTATLVPVEEYLRTSYKPACDYIDGVLRQKALPTKKHSRLQFKVASLVNRDWPQYEALPELTLRIRQGKYLVPDVAVMERGDSGDPYPTIPVHLCVEIVSPEDRLSSVVAKCEEYHAWGVPYTWIIDPQARRAFQYDADHRLVELAADGALRAGEIAVSCADVFAGLD